MEKKSEKKKIKSRRKDRRGKEVYKIQGDVTENKENLEKKKAIQQTASQGETGGVGGVTIGPGIYFLPGFIGPQNASKEFDVQWKRGVRAQTKTRDIFLISSFSREKENNCENFHFKLFKHFLIIFLS